MTNETKDYETIYWSVDPEAEELEHESPDDAISEWLDWREGDRIDPDLTITVCGFKRMKITPQTSYGALCEQLLENLDCDYGRPDDWTEPSEAMIAAEQAFVEAVIADYTVWACEPSGEEITVNALEWTKKNRPEWLEGER